MHMFCRIQPNNGCHQNLSFSSRKVPSSKVSFDGDGLDGLVRLDGLKEGLTLFVSVPFFLLFTIALTRGCALLNFFTTAVYLATISSYDGKIPSGN